MFVYRCYKIGRHLWSRLVHYILSLELLRLAAPRDSMNECVFIYRTYHIVSQGGLQFHLSEIGRQLVKAPLATAISPYVISLTHPTLQE